MERGTSQQGARPKTQSNIGDSSGFGTFLIDLRNSLTYDNIRTLATALDFTPEERAKVEQRKDPGHVFVHLLKEKGVISQTDISALTTKLTFCGLHGVTVEVNRSFQRYRSEMRPQSRESQKLKDKKIQFIKELRAKYKTLCGQILPVPFLRDKYKIDKLFVESGMKLLEDKQGNTEEDEKWKEIKNHNVIFTDPRIKSSRRIIDGEPGYGKTILALKMTNDWCQGKAPMKDYEILILLRLRQFRSLSSVYLAIKKFLLPKDSTLTEADINNILDCSSVVVLLDGYDEYPERWNKKTDIEYIIKGEMFQKHEVVLLTRTSCLPFYTSSDTKRISLTGFDDTVRYTYILNVVARGDHMKAQELVQLLDNNPAAADLCKVPMFCVMICHMAKREAFEGLQTVTKLFSSVIACFHSHEQRRAVPTDVRQREGGRDHSRLDKIAFEALRGDSLKIIWDEKELRRKLGDDLYTDYVSIGIFREEDVFDENDFDYKTETRFFHKLFAEWYAAHYLANEFAQSKAQSEHRHNIHEEARGKSQDLSKECEKVNLLRDLNPRDIHYMYRFACGLDSDVAMEIIKYLSKNEAYDKCTLLCITEWMTKWRDSLETIEDTATVLCSRRLFIKGTDSLLIQKSSLELIRFASRRKIPLKDVVLYNCLDIGGNGNLCVQPSNLSLPVMDTVSKLRIYRYDGEITEDETNSIFQYLAKCLNLTYIRFSSRLIAARIKATESMSVLRSRKVIVAWWSTAKRTLYVLNFESGQWDLDLPVS